MTPMQERAALAAARRLSAGSRLTVATRSFWRDYGDMTVSERREVIAAATDISYASGIISSGGYSGSIADVYGSAPSGVDDGYGGVFGNRQATIYATVEFGRGNKKEYKGISLKMDWDARLEDIDLEVADMIAEWEDFYGLSGGIVVGGYMVF